MSKKILFLIISAFLVASCGKSDDWSDVTNTSLSNSWVSFDKVYDNIKSEYKENSIMNTCLVNSTNMCLSQAVNEKARTKNDESICEDLSDKMAAEYCKQWIIQVKIEKTWDISLCDSLKQSKDNCISQASLSLAIKNKDLKACDNIKDPASNSWSWLPQMMSTKQNCISQASFSIATSKQDETYCDKIANENQKKMCKNSVEMQKNIKTQQAFPLR